MPGSVLRGRGRADKCLHLPIRDRSRGSRNGKREWEDTRNYFRARELPRDVDSLTYPHREDKFIPRRKI